MQRQPPQEAQKGYVCRTPNIFKKRRTLEGQELLTKRERFWLRHGSRARSTRRWRTMSDPLSAKRCLFPEERRASSGEESDESGYSYGSFLESSCQSDVDSNDTGDSRVRNYSGRENLLCTSEEDRDWECQGRADYEDTSDFEQLEQNDYVTGIKLQCKEEAPKLVIDYPYADDCPEGIEVAYEVEVFTDE